MTVVHINTELRVAWRKALEESLLKDETELVPYKLLAEPLRAVQSVVRQRLELFNSMAAGFSQLGRSEEALTGRQNL